MAAAQREFAGSPDYLGLLAGHGLLRDGLTPKRAGKILGRVMTGFFTQPADEDAGELLADVMARTLMPDPPQDPEAVSALADDVSGLFRGIIAVQRQQLERAY